MKRIIGFCVVGLCGALALGNLTGCVAPERSGSATVVRSGDARPSEIQPKPRTRTRSKQVEQEGIITIVKAAPSPTPSAKGKRTAKLPKKGMKNVPTGTNVPFYFSIESGFWPTGLDYAEGTARCYEVTALNPGTSTPITASTSALSVFPGGASYQNIELTPDGTVQVNLNFPSSLAGKELILTITAAGEYGTTTYTFSGANIFVVNP